MKIFENHTQLKEFLQSNREQISFVPTMGNLHEGHISLVETAKGLSQTVVCSIFVNPTQFSANEDFATYPKTLEKDLQKLEKAGVSAVYIPSVKDIYPTKSTLNFDIPHLTKCLCGISRPHFFNGVMTVVLKFLIQVQPRFLILGEKDFQQFLVVKSMVESIGLPVDVISSPIIRNENGLALSSRNGYFASLKIPEKINGILFDFAQNVKINGIENAFFEAKKSLNFLDEIDYLEVRSSADLSLYQGGDFSEYRLFFAGTIDRVRLIDNISLANFQTQNE